ncbi:hypothetical protein J3R83DRAFT_150 [Lanmaoa asiatica]|nr:hypothetical protein J3R83DRAFT_150 [Lanmaoa asiatica]
MRYHYPRYGYARSFNFIEWFINNQQHFQTIVRAPLVSITTSDTTHCRRNDGQNVKIARQPLTTAHIDVAQSSTSKIPAIPTIPKITIPMGRLIPSKGNGKKNQPCNSLTTTLQYTKTSQPSAGLSPDVRDKPPTASPEKARSGAGLSSKISALPTPRRSTPPAARKSPIPSLAKHAAVVDSSHPTVRSSVIVLL